MPRSRFRRRRPESIQDHPAAAPAARVVRGVSVVAPAAALVLLAGAGVVGAQTVGAARAGGVAAVTDTLGTAAAVTAPPGAGVVAAPALRGVVIDAESGRPVGDAELIVRAVGDRRDAPARAVVRAGADGAWRVAGLPAGRYQLRARRIGYVVAERTVRVGEEGAAPAQALRVALTPQAVSLETAVVTASRRIQKLKEAPVAVQLVGRRDIERSGATNVAAVLTEQAGLQPDGGTPSGVGVMLQGMDAQRVLILLDGQPLTGRINGNFDLSRLPASMVQRIEIVKGPQSTLYGSDALGGVVNIITRDLATRAWGGSLGVQGGTQGRRDLTGSLLGAAGPVHFSADLGRRDVNLTPGRDDQIGTEAGRWDGALKARWRPDSSLALEASTLVLDEAQRFRIGTNWFFADRQQATARLAGTWTRGRTRLAPTLHYTHFDHLYRRSLADRPLSRLGDHDTQRLLVGELLASHVRGRTALDAGTSVRRESAASTRVVSDRGATNGLRDRVVAEPYAQLTVGGGDGRWSVVPGLRLTADQQWGTHWTPRVATMFRPAQRLAVRASAGRGFRAPDFKEQFLQFQHISESFAYFVRGNPALRPELSDNVSGSVEWAGSRLYVRADLFDNRFRDFIESRVVGDTTVATSANPIAYYTYGNVGRGRTHGTDLEAVLRLGALRVDGGYSWLEARDQDADRPLLGRARHTARLGLGGTHASGASATLNAQWTGRAPVAIGGAGTPLVRDAWLRVNARVAHTLAQALGGAWRAELGASNLLDARPNLWPGFTGRQLYTGLTWQAGRALTAER